MFLRKTIGFVNKNILVMLLLSLPAAVCFTLGGKPLGIVEFFVEMFGNVAGGDTAYTFYAIFDNFSVIDFRQPWQIAFMLLGLFCLGLIFSLVERTMKYGSFSMGSVRSLLLDALFITFPVGVLFVLGVEIVGLVVSGLIALFALLGYGWLWFGLSLAATVIIYVVCASFICYLVCWIPCISMEGLKCFMAASLSARMASKRHVKIFATVGTVIAVVTVLTYFVNLAGVISYFALCAVLNILLSVYLPAYCYTAYFRLSDIPLGAKR